MLRPYRYRAIHRATYRAIHRATYRATYRATVTCSPPETAGREYVPTKLIVLIEPEASLREVLYICLSELGDWQVAVASSIQEGMHICQSIHPDAILLDASVAETDALIFIEQLKQHSMMRSIPILLITARASWFNPVQLSEMGFSGAIAKPFNPSTLSAQITNLLAGGCDNELID